MKSNIIVEKGAKLKLDINNENLKGDKLKDQKGILANITNYGELYSYSDNDIIAGKYTPVRYSKTYVSPTSMLSIANLDLTRTDNFTLDVFKARGISRALNKFKSEYQIFEAKANQDEVLTRVKLGVYPISEKISFSLEYKDKTLIGKIMLGGLSKPAEDKRPGNDRLPYLSTIEERLKKVREKLDEEAEKRAKEIAEKEKETHPKPTSMYSLSSVEEALDTILYANSTDVRNMDGEALADSLTAGHNIASLKVNLNNSLLNEKLDDKKINIFANNINEINITKNSINRLTINSRLNGVNVALGYRTGNIKLYAGIDYLNGNHTQDNILSTKFNSLGVSGLMRYSKNNLEVDFGITSNMLFKKVFKEY